MSQAQPSSNEPPAETGVDDVDPSAHGAQPLIIGVGASAGGLEALKELASGLPDDLKASIVVVQHLSPTHTSMLRDLLQPESDLAVVDLQDGVGPQPGTVYITPPNHNVEFANGVLRLRPADPGVGPKPSVDRFLKSLAVNHGANTVAIILSGTGTDGADGVRAVKAAGGVVLVQDPQTAKYDGMPRAAIQTGCVDLVLPAPRMGEVLARIAETPDALRQPSGEDPGGGERERITAIVRELTGFDLSHYKTATVVRRLIRRMTLNKCRTLSEYAEKLKGDRTEAMAAARDVLISVTSFFRDPDAFDALRPHLEKLVASAPRDEVLRVWVPGCATGEEAYSLAMILSELCSGREGGPDFLIFATDLDAEAVNFARNGVYPDSAIGDLPEALRARYFERLGGAWQVRKSLRQNTVFAVQNVIEDPPFPRMDLISCRNLLIYLTRSTQRRLLETFHYALKPGGLLFLGKSESIELHRNLFDVVDRHAKLFRRREVGGAYPVPLGTRRDQEEQRRQGSGGRRSADTMSLGYRMLDALTEVWCPPTVVVNDNDECVHFVGDLKPFRRFPRGPAQMRLFDLLHDKLRAEVRALVHRARREGAPQRGNAFTVERDGQVHHHVVAVTPLPRHEKLLAIGFPPASETPARDLLDGDQAVRESLIIEELERELANTRQHLQTVVEELETSNEELLSQSEELQSANEELQSTNEELQTTNEELQSTNEELLTVNDELQTKSRELAEVADSLRSVMESLDFPLLVLDREMRLQHFNRAACEQLAGSELQPGQSLAAIEWQVELAPLVPRIREVMRERRAVEVQLEDAGGRWWTVRILPPATEHDSDAIGVVLTFADVTTRRAAERALAEREALFRLNFEHSPMGMAVLDPSLQITRANPALCRITGLSAEALRRRSLPSLLRGDKAHALRVGLDALLSGERDTLSGEFQLAGDGGEGRWVLINAVAIRDAASGPTQLAVQMQDVSRQHTAQDQLVQENRRLELLAEMLALDPALAPAKLAAEAVAILHGRVPQGRVALALFDGTDAFEVVACRQAAGLPSLGGRRIDATLVRQTAGAPATREGSEAGCIAVAPDAPLARALAPGEDASGQRLLVLLARGQPVGLLSVEAGDEVAGPAIDGGTLEAIAPVLAGKLAESRRRQQAGDPEQAAMHLSRLEVALAAIADGIITIDERGLVQYLNAAAEHLTGVSAQEAAGQPLDGVFRLVRASDERPMPNPAMRSLKDGVVVDRLDEDCFLVHRSGRQIVVQCSAAPHTEADGRIRGAILVFRDITDQNLLATELSWRASHDPLTGLPNREEFDRRLRSALREAQRSGVTHVLAYLDIDQFKIVNDTCGHGTGDELLRQIAELLQTRLGSQDVLARLGGDEFGLLLAGVDLDSGRRRIEQMMAALRAFRFQWREQRFRVSASCGIAALDRHTRSTSDVLSQVDAACFAAKESGRDRIQVVGADGVAAGHGEMHLVSRIAHALEQDRFALRSEPVVSLDESRELLYREVLLRLADDGDDEVPTSRLISAAERYTLMAAVDRWVVQRALQLIARQGGDEVYAINLSGQTLGEEQTLGFILRQIDRSGVDPRRLCFEITETAAVSHLSEALRFMQTLAERGVRFALDDFGSGLASFAYLKQLPVSFLKIDGGFVRGLPDNTFDRTMVSAIQRVADDLGLITIAEHAQTEAIVDTLRELGVRYAQGQALGNAAPLGGRS